MDGHPAASAGCGALACRTRGPSLSVRRDGGPMTTRALALLTAVAALALSGCGDSSPPDAASSPAVSSSSGPSGTLTVFAAASLTDVFGDLGDQLMADDPGLDVQFNFAASSALATQLTQGAPADVFASANGAQMKVVTDADLQAGDPTTF